MDGILEAWEFLRSNYIYLRHGPISIRYTVLHEKIKQIQDSSAIKNVEITDHYILTLRISSRILICTSVIYLTKS